MVFSKITFVKDVLRVTSGFCQVMLRLDMERIWHPLLVRAGANKLKLQAAL